MKDTEALFAFELDFSGAMNCIPMGVRFKLDGCGVKLSLKQWNLFTQADRESLLKLPCESGEQAQNYRAGLARLVEATGSGPLRELPLEAHPEWGQSAQVPAQLIAYCEAQGLASVTLPQWSALTPLQRFVLIKLSHPDHRNKNFLPALREFGLLQD